MKKCVNKRNPGSHPRGGRDRCEKCSNNGSTKKTKPLNLAELIQDDSDVETNNSIEELAEKAGLDLSSFMSDNCFDGAKPVQETIIVPNHPLGKNREIEKITINAPNEPYQIVLYEGEFTEDEEIAVRRGYIAPENLQREVGVMLERTDGSSIVVQEYEDSGYNAYSPNIIEVRDEDNGDTWLHYSAIY